MSVCLAIHLPITYSVTSLCPAIHLSFQPSICPSPHFHPCICSLIHASAHPSIHSVTIFYQFNQPSVHPDICVHLSMHTPSSSHLSIYPSNYLSMYPLISLPSVCPSIIHPLTHFYPSIPSFLSIHPPTQSSAHSYTCIHISIHLSTQQIFFSLLCAADSTAKQSKGLGFSLLSLTCNSL